MQLSISKLNATFHLEINLIKDFAVLTCQESEEFFFVPESHIDQGVSLDLIAICHNPETIMAAEPSHIHTKGRILEIHWESPVPLLELDGFELERCVSSSVLPDES